MKVMHRLSKPKIGIVRGLMPRFTQAEFACSFKRFEPTFITGEARGEIKDFCNKEKLNTRDLRLKKILKIDPVEILLGNRTHQSFVGLEGLRDAVRGLDVLETYELYHFFSGQAAEAAKDLKIPLVCEVWTSFLHPAYFIPPYSFTVRKVIKNTRLFIARSYKAKRALLKLGIPKEKIRVVYHGVNLRRFRGSRRNRGHREIVILYVGEMEEYKGVGDLLKIWPEIYKKHPHANLWLVGKGSLLEEAKGMTGVKVHGYVFYRNLPKIYSQADIFISPSKNRYLGPFLWWEEFFSYTLMEAQASGLPIVATRCGGIPEEIGDKNLLIKLGDTHGLKMALIKLIEDESLRRSLGLGNRERAEKLFDLYKQTEVLEDKIQEVIK